MYIYVYFYIITFTLKLRNCETTSLIISRSTYEKRALRDFSKCRWSSFWFLNKIFNTL